MTDEYFIYSFFKIYKMQHEVGSLGMANFGKSNSNNSQFFVTTVESSHLDGSNVVFGHVIRGFGCFHEMEKFANNESVPMAVSKHLTLAQIQFMWLNCVIWFFTGNHNS